jgi:hypothetical protein
MNFGRKIMLLQDTNFEAASLPVLPVGRVPEARVSKVISRGLCSAGTSTSSQSISLSLSVSFADWSANGEEDIDIEYDKR